MNCTIDKTRFLLILALVACTLSAAPVWAEESEDSGKRGLFVGINAGAGSSSMVLDKGDRTISINPSDGALGALRFGYAFSPKFALSLEGYGFGSGEDDGEEWGLGAAFLAATWHPCGKGLFVRAGLGGGGGDYVHPDTGEKTTITDRGAVLFSVGYDWGLSENTTLGLSADGFMIDGGDIPGYDDGGIGANGLTLQFNWYL